ncbi:MAG: metallophosphoesterase [Sedimentisphaerales bacterium]|jgi:3',5'-cyclic AMP phosphodiesterase CpdA
MPEKNIYVSRRNFLTGAATAGLALTVSKAVAMGTKSNKNDLLAQRAKRTIRFAHFTDIHIDPNRHAPEGFAAALQHVQAIDDKPEMIITGGDHVMDSLGANDNWTRVQFALLKKVLAKECSLPVKFCIGNHDVWGWDKEKSKTTGQEPLWGKKRAVQELNLTNRYYSFDIKPWHIIILDSTYPSSTIYTARLDDEQFGWLQQELETYKNMHVCIISHIPILSVAAFLDGDNEKSGHWTLPDEWMHIDARKMKDLFLNYPNVHLCISGHMHMVDRALYNGVTYICDGAICGAWWKGKNYEFKEGYGIFDLFDDGTFEHKYIEYGWKAV